MCTLFDDHKHQSNNFHLLVQKYKKFINELAGMETRYTRADRIRRRSPEIVAPTVKKQAPPALSAAKAFVRWADLADIFIFYFGKALIVYL